MILLGIVYGAVTGNMQAVTDAAFASAKEAVTLCITSICSKSKLYRQCRRLQPAQKSNLV